MSKEIKCKYHEHHEVGNSILVAEITLLEDLPVKKGDTIRFEINERTKAVKVIHQTNEQ